MSSKSYSEQWRKNRKKKRKRKHNTPKHNNNDAEKDEEQDLLQSQDLLDNSEGDEQMIQQRYEEIPREQQQVLEEPMDVENASRAETVDSVEMQQQESHEAAATKVQEEPQGDDDLSLSTNQSSTTGEERLRILLSQALLDLTASQENCENIQQALSASQTQCRQLQQTLSQTQEQCEVYHKKYSALKQKFYRWYNHCLLQWAAKFQQGETRDVPPHPEVVGLSPLSSRQAPPRNLQDEAMRSVLQPRRILQDTEGGNSVTPSPLRSELSNDSELQPKRLSTDLHGDLQGKENVQNESSASSDGSSKERLQTGGVQTSPTEPKVQNDSFPGAHSNEEPTDTERYLNTLTKKGDTADHSEASEKQLCASSNGDEAHKSKVHTKQDASPRHTPDETKAQVKHPNLRDQSGLSEPGGTAKDDTASASPPQAFEKEETHLEVAVASHRESSVGNLRSSPNETSNQPPSPVGNLLSSKGSPRLSERRLHDGKTKHKHNSLQVFEQVNDDASQPLFSQLPPTPERKQFKPPRLARRNPKHASALRATQGWTSNVAARTFIRETMNPPETKKRPQSSFSPDAVSSGNTMKPDSRPQSDTKPPAKTNQALPNPPENPYRDSDSSKVSTPAKRTTRTGIEWSDDEDEDSPKYKYNEVVRCRHQRQQLQGHCCEECKKYFDAVCDRKGAQYFDRKEMMDMSRHRARHTPDNTPPDFWELSFVDERQARERDGGDSQF